MPQLQLKNNININNGYKTLINYYFNLSNAEPMNFRKKNKHFH